MNRATRQLFIDALIALAIGSVLAAVTYFLGMHFQFVGLHLEWSIIPIIWFAIRQGPAATVVVGAIQGLIIGLAIQNIVELDTVNIFIYILLYQILPYILLTVAGFFAKYTQKTLNNRRLSSTYLNIATASFLASILFYIVRFWLVPLALNQQTSIEIVSWQFWVSALIIILVTSLLLWGFVRIKPNWIIPKRSKYLSRKETSSLLND